MSRGRKIWYMFAPAAVFVLCSLLGSVLIARICTAAGIREVKVFAGTTVSAALIASLAGFVLAILVQRVLRKQDARVLGKEQLAWTPVKILLGIGAVVGLGLLENVLINLSRLYEIFPHYQTLEAVNTSNQNPVLLFLTMAVLGPLAEELTFRGLMLRRARTWMGPAGAIVLSALVFGVCHLNMVQLIYAFPLGILLGVLYDKSGNLLTPVLAHMALNAVTLLLS